MKNYLILNIDTKTKTLWFQVNKRDTAGICYNLTFTNETSYLACAGFMISTFSGNYNIPIQGNSDTRCLIHCLKILPKIQENKTDLISFLSDLIKKEKLTDYQININGNMDYSNARKIDNTTLALILKELNNFSFPANF